MREMPGVPPIVFEMCDVRDVARAHILAMRAPADKVVGKRFAIANGATPLRDVAALLAAEFNPRGYRVPLVTLPVWLLRVAGLYDPAARAAAANANVVLRVSSAAAETTLGLRQRSLRDSVIDMAYSMIAAAQVPDLSKGGAILAKGPFVVDVNTEGIRATACPAADDTVA